MTAPVEVAPPVGLASTNATRAGWLALALGVLFLAFVASLAIGVRSVPFGDAFHALFEATGTQDARVIREIRLPRTVVGVLVGIAMGLAGALIQAMTRNPLADPGILGVNAGAGFMLLVAIVVFHLRTPAAYVWFSFAGAIAATILVYALGAVGRGGATPERLAVAGIAAGSAIGGFGTVLVVLHPGVYQDLHRWSVGQLANPHEGVLTQLTPFLLVGIVLALALARPMNALALGDDLARALGVDAGRIRIAGVVAVTLLAGAGTAAAGPIAFVGFVVPHVARRICGPDLRWVFLFTIALAPTLVLVSDLVARMAVRPGELPVGVVVAFVGAPLLIHVVRRRKLLQL